MAALELQISSDRAGILLNFFTYARLRKGYIVIVFFKITHYFNL